MSIYQLKMKYRKLVHKSADRKQTSPKQVIEIRKELSEIRKQMKRLNQEEKQMNKNSVLFNWEQSPEAFRVWAGEVGGTICEEVARDLIKTDDDIQKFMNAWDYDLNSVQDSIFKGIILA